MRTALLVTGSILIGIIIVALSFCGAVILVGFLYLRHVKYGGLAGIPALILGVIAGVPAALIAGYFWLSFCLGQFAKKGIIPNEPLRQRRGA